MKVVGRIIMKDLRLIPKALLCLFVLVFVLAVSTGGLDTTKIFAQEKEYYHVVVLGDTHLPGKSIPAKENVIKTINSWPDVDMVVVLGDICFELGTAEEYAYAKQFFSSLNKPTYFIVGNHDYIYEDYKDVKGKKKKGSSVYRKSKLKLFKETFGLQEVYYSKRVGNYLLVFLSTDDLTSDYLAQISGQQLDWLRSELNKNKEVPTLIFFHSPLKGTLLKYTDIINTDDFIAQPHKKLHEVILQNPQIFLWVSGHTHTPATNESFKHEINVYEKQVTNIHNTDINRETIWTNSLYLYPDKVVVKTYNHKKGVWMENLERIIIPSRKTVGSTYSMDHLTLYLRLMPNFTAF